MTWNLKREISILLICNFMLKKFEKFWKYDEEKVNFIKKIN